MDIFSLFRGTQNASAAQPQQSAQPEQPPTQEGVQKAQAPTGEVTQLEAKGTASNTPPAPTETSKKEDSPLAGFEKIWDNVGTGAGQMPSLNADPAKISEAAKKIDFTKGIDPALLQKAVSGDAGALIQAINQAAQNAFTVATQASTHLVDKHTAAVSEHLQRDLPNRFRTFQANDSLLSENPKLANPAVQPLIQVIQQQLASQFPQATSAELRAHAVKYLQGVVSAVAPEGNNGAKGGTKSGVKKQQEAQANNQFDWATWAQAQEGSQEFSSQ